MHLLINNEEYLVPEEEQSLLLRQVHKMLVAEYEKLDEKWRLVAKPVAREVLRRMEDTIRKKHGKDASLVMRPDKKTDPCLHLSYVLMSMLQEALKNVTVSVGTEDYTASNFKLSIESKSEAGGQMVTDGYERVREDNCT